MDSFRAPEETRAQARTWDVVAAAFAEREPVRRRSRRAPLRPLLALAVVAALAAVAFTSPGQAVVTSVRKAIGIEHAQRALYSLPAPGRVLAGGWIVAADGSTRHLGDYDDTSWSPFGRFVVATRGDDLYALQPDGTIRWKLGRPVVRDASWTGTRTDTRIAYLSGQRLRVVAGDGTGDREVGPVMSADVAPVWRPGAAPFVLTYADIHGRVWALEPDTRRLLFRVAAPRATKLAWSHDGARLVVLTRTGVRVFDARGKLVRHERGRFVDAAFVGDDVAVLSRHAVTLGGRTLFRTSGSLAQVVASPDRRWLLVTWPEARQWLFVPTAGTGHLKAVGNVDLPPVAGWTS
ncbi:MAG TPA: hypothetical protein VGK79_10130 [Gaiellaceae bacterium]